MVERMGCWFSQGPSSLARSRHSDTLKQPCVSGRAEESCRPASGGTLVAGLFISYRRADHPEVVRDLYGRLVARYSSARVFRDIDNLVGGMSFPEQLRDALTASSV